MPADNDELLDDTTDDDPTLAYLDDNDAPTFERFKDPRVKTRTAKKQAEMARQLTDATENVLFETTYKPSRHEATWIYSSLKPFFDDLKLIDDVLFQVKGGKEASVYCCQVHPGARAALGVERVAAKVYRPRQVRNLRNDALYREGRPVLTDEGRAAKATDTRLMRALGKKTDFGVQVQHSSWLLYEYTTLQHLHAAGAAVPAPYSVAENAILMGYIGDETRGAPTLIEVALEPTEAKAVFEQVRRSLAILLQLGLVHGDLSAYNILYHEGEATLIDFPQVMNRASNAMAETILERDLTRVCEYFSRQGVTCDPKSLRHALEK